MRTSPMLDFPVQEYENRRAVLMEYMKEAGLDGFMVTSMENTRYYTGLQSVIWPSKLSTPGLAIFNADGEVYIVGSASAQDTARYTGCVEDDHVIHFSRNNIPGVALTYPEAICDTLIKMGLFEGKLGIEIGRGTRLHLQMQWMDEIREKMSGLELVDASEIIWKQRAIKSPAEIEVIRKVCRLNELCYKKVFESLVPGKTTEAEMFRIYAQEAFRLHCENVSPMGMFFGNRSILGNCPQSEKVVFENKPHNTVFIDGGPIYQGYHSDIIRVGVIGGLNDKQKSLLAASDDALSFSLDMIRDGVSAKDVCNKLDAHIRTTSEAEHYCMYGWMGHGIGLEIHEEPELSADNEFIIRKGMVLAIEPLFGTPDFGIVGNEQNILVTEDGYELLTPSSTRPYIL